MPQPVSENLRAAQAPCMLCEGKTGIVIASLDRHHKPLTVMVCAQCGIVHNHPIPTAAELAAFYANDYRRVYKNTTEPKKRHAVRYFPSVAEHIRSNMEIYAKTRNILDVGSGSGEFLYLMKCLNKQVIGLEPNIDYAAFCKAKLGIPITTGGIDDFHPTEKYDHIRLSHVVEHLRDPIGYLKILREWLKPGGTLYVEVPDFETYCQVKSPGGMFHFGHIYNFDRHTFSHLAGAAGFRIAKRLGNTSAFLEPTESPCDFFPASAATIGDKLTLYARHKAGALARQRKGTKLFGKFQRMLKEQIACSTATDYKSIGDRWAATITPSKP